MKQEPITYIFCPCETSWFQNRLNIRSPAEKVVVVQSTLDLVNYSIATDFLPARSTTMDCNQSNTHLIRQKG